MTNEYGYRWVHGLDVPSVAHYAAFGRHIGHQTVCGKAKIGPDWSGPLDPVLPHLGAYPLPEVRCGDCVVAYLVETHQIKLKVNDRTG